MSQSYERATVDEYNDLLAEYNDLLAEVERLRGEVERERAAVVKWLRAEAEAAAQTFTVQAGEWANRIDGLAGDIERGEYRREGGE